MTEIVPQPYQRHPLATTQGAFAFSVWSAYLLCVALYFPDVLTSVLVAAFFGLAAWVVMVFNFTYWRSTVLVAASAYLLLYVIRIVRMTAIPGDLSFLSALSFYYKVSWRVAIGAFEEKGRIGGLMHAFMEYAMPVLVIALISLFLISSRRKPGVWRTEQ